MIVGKKLEKPPLSALPVTQAQRKEVASHPGEFVVNAY